MPALGEHPRQLHDQHGAAAVVVGAGGVDVRVERPGRRSGGAAIERELALRQQAQRVVVAAHVDPPRGSSRKHGDDVAQLDTPRDPGRCRRPSRFGACRRPPAASGWSRELVEDRLPRGADAAGWRRRLRQGVAGSEPDQRPQQAFEARLGDGPDHRGDLWIEVRRHRGLGGGGGAEGEDGGDERGPATPHQNSKRAPSCIVVGTPPDRSVVRLRKSVERRSPIGLSKLARLVTLKISAKRSSAWLVPVRMR